MGSWDMDLAESSRAFIPFPSDASVQGLYWLALASVTRHHSLGGLHSRNASSLSFGGWKSMIRVSAGLIPIEGCKEESVPGLSPSFWRFSGSLRHSSACRHTTPLFTVMCTQCSSCTHVCLHNFPFYNLLVTLDWSPC